MKILLAEDDFASRKFMGKYLSKYGECDITVDGKEALEAFLMAWEDEEPYDLLCLDIMMPVMDGFQVLEKVRREEEKMGIASEKRARIIMTTALNEEKNVKKAFHMDCTAYIGKPIDVEKFDLLFKKLFG